MGLYAISLREEAPGQVAVMLSESGYLVAPHHEDDDAQYFVCHGGRRPLQFWITKRCPPRFCIGVGERGTEIVRILAQKGAFRETGDSG